MYAWLSLWGDRPVVFMVGQPRIKAGELAGLGWPGNVNLRDRFCLRTPGWNATRPAALRAARDVMDKSLRRWPREEWERLNGAQSMEGRRPLCDVRGEV